MNDLHTMKFYFEEAQIFEDEPKHSIDITKKFSSWMDGHTLSTIIIEFAYCLMAMTYQKESIKDVMAEIADTL